MKYIVILLSIIFTSANLQAMYFSSYIYEMGSQEDFISKYITNDTETTNLYSISTYAIEKPSNTNEIRINTKDKELLYAPLRSMIDKKATNLFKIFYRGPKDDKERYYRVVFTETPLTLYDNNQPAQTSTYIPSIALSTILIIRPRKQKFDYVVDESKGTLKNTGNTFFRAIVHNQCNQRDEDADHVYILPGEEYQNDFIRTGSKIFLVINKQYRMVKNTCPVDVDPADTNANANANADQYL